MAFPYRRLNVPEMIPVAQFVLDFVLSMMTWRLNLQLRERRRGTYIKSPVLCNVIYTYRGIPATSTDVIQTDVIIYCLVHPLLINACNRKINYHVRIL